MHHNIWQRQCMWPGMEPPPLWGRGMTKPLSAAFIISPCSETHSRVHFFVLARHKLPRKTPPPLPPRPPHHLLPQCWGAGLFGMRCLLWNRVFNTAQQPWTSWERATDEKPCSYIHCQVYLPYTLWVNKISNIFYSYYLSLYYILSCF